MAKEIDVIVIESSDEEGAASAVSVGTRMEKKNTDPRSNVAARQPLTLTDDDDDDDVTVVLPATGNAVAAAAAVAAPSDDQLPLPDGVELAVTGTVGTGSRDMPVRF